MNQLLTARASKVGPTVEGSTNDKHKSFDQAKTLPKMVVI